MTFIQLLAVIKTNRMGNFIFDTILTEKIDAFVSSFNNTSETIFLDKETGKPIHPGEYGMYREKVLKEFLRLIIPLKLEITDGFIISNNDFVSTQCDIIIYDKKTTPLIQSQQNQTFYPIETVVGIGEVKSKMKRGELITALVKLAQTKIIRSELKVSTTTYREIPHDKDGLSYKYDAQLNPNDQITTFLICKKFEFNVANFINDIDSEYEKHKIPNYAKHNIILSLEDGIILYRNSDNKTLYAPVIFGVEQKSRFVQPENEFDHIRIFAMNLFLAISTNTVIYPEMSSYINEIPYGTIIDK